MSQSKVNRLVAQVGNPRLARRIGATEERRTRLARAQEPEIVAERLVAAERAFLQRSLEKKAKVFRGGWPDFLLERENGRAIGVEVKRGANELSSAQVKMLAALERAGIDSYVWNPRWPNRLTPWRKYGVREGKSW